MGTGSPDDRPRRRDQPPTRHLTPKEAAARELELAKAIVALWKID
jgi:hypothetical protein